MKNRRPFLAVLGLLLLSSVGCGSSQASIKSSRNPSLKEPIRDALGVAVFQRGLDTATAESIGEEITDALVGRKLRASFSIVPTDESLGPETITGLAEEYGALLLVAAMDPEGTAEGAAPMRFRLGVKQFFAHQTEDTPSGVRVIDVWEAEADAPKTSSPEEMSAALASLVVHQLVTDDVIP